VALINALIHILADCGTLTVGISAVGLVSVGVIEL
jgi:hypothetical protein